MEVTIQRYTSVSDGMGGDYYEWSDHLTVEGTLDKLSGDEILASEKINKTSSHVFITFEIVDITAEDRMIVGDYIHDIRDVDNPNYMNRQLEITVFDTGQKVDHG
ncbi:phage head closure protein [Oceanobacillus kimchii]|uniref:phage head closure protein n=1 Tax=Oceanobacillus kimchii TaxID=746691 RepID=UPI003B01FD66